MTTEEQNWAFVFSNREVFNREDGGVLMATLKMLH